MKEESLRLKKVNELLRQQMAEILEKEIGWKAGVFVTVAKVRVTPDLRRAAVLVSVFPVNEERYALETLKKELYTLQGMLNKRLHMRPLPRIVFEADKTEEYAQSVEDILRDPNF